MNSLTLRLFCLLICMIGFLQRGVAQGCGVLMTKKYNVYNTESVSTTHTQGGFSNTVVYTSVLTDGYATCQPSPSCPCNSAKHTPSAYNRVYNSRISVGGQLTGTPQCVSCYLSIQNSQSVNTSPGELFNFDSNGQITCSLVGVFFFSSNLFQLEAATTRVISYGPQTGCYSTGTGTNCYYPVNNWCSPASTPPDNNFNGSNLKDAWPITFPAVWDAIAGCARIRGLTSWHCTGAIAYIMSQGNPVAPTIDCTHNP
jgi:hypothetical protein